jgi:four helix bundle protein
MRRSAVSVASNIAEGFGRRRQVEFGRFLEMAKGSLFELQTQGELARRLGWLQGEPLIAMRDLSQEVDAVLTGLIRSLRQ